MENKLNPQPQFQTLTVVKDPVSRLLLKPLLGSPTTHRANVFVFLRFALCLLLMVGAGEVSGQAFITRWVTTTNTITIPTTGGGYNYNITWTNLTNAGVGDGSFVGATGNYTITGLQNTSTYQVAISGAFPRFFMNANFTERTKLRTIEQWGSIAWTSMARAFQGCSNLTYNAIDNPNLGAVNNMSYMFAGCSVFNGNINFWNTINVINMSYLFNGCSIFNQPLDSWNVSNVTNMQDMFWDATSFNQPLNSWNVSNATNMQEMFMNCYAFNQPLDSWNVSSVTNMRRLMFIATSFNQPLDSWNVSNVTNMSYLFSGCSAFNQPLNSWNVSNVTDMAGMFFNTTSFNQPLNSWNVGNVTAMGGMFFNTTSFNQPLDSWNVSNVTIMLSMLDNNSLSVANYDATLISWAAQTLKPNVNLGAASLNYCSAMVARNILISTPNNWIITGDNLFCPPSTLTATPTSSTSIDLSWTDNSTNETAFKIQRSLTSGTGFTTIATLATNTITYTDNTVAAGTTYYYRIIATNGGGDSAPSNEANANTLSFGLVAYYPFSGNANDASGNGNNGTVNGATLTTDRFCNPNSAYNFNGVSDYIDIGLNINPNFFTISSWFNASGLSADNAIISKIHNISPDLFKNFEIDILASKLRIIVANGLIWEEIQLNIINLNEWNNVVLSYDGSIAKIFLNGIFLNQFTTNYQQSNVQTLIGARPANGLGTIDNYFNGQIDDVRIYNRALSPAEIANLYDVTAAPSALAATPISSSQINLSWTDNSSNENSYVVERSLTSGSGFAVLATLPANTVAYSDNTVSEGVSYFYRLTALKACYQSSYSNEATATTPFNAPTVSAIAAPTPLAASLTFADNSTIEDNIEIERSLTSGTGFTVLATLAANTTTYADNTVTEGITYFYRLRNFKTPSTYSAYSAEASVGVPAFAAPTVLFAAAVNITQINLSWADNTTFETAYLLERSLLPTSGFALIATLPAGSTFYADNTALPATQYYYRVRAGLTPIFSAYSNVAGATTADITPLAQATNITLAAIFAQSLGISWTNGDGANRVVKINTTNNFTNLVNATAYTANSNYGGIGEQVVYNGGGNTAFVGGLQPKTKYFFKVYEYNGTGVTASYLNTSAQGNPASFLTFATPPIPPTDLVFTDITTTTISGNFKFTQGAEGYLIVRRAKESSPQVPPNGLSLKIGDIFSSGQVVVGVGKLTTFKAEKLTPATDYTFDIYAYNGENESIAYSVKPLSGTARTHNPLPILEAISPTQALAGQGLVTLSAFGTDFVKGATVLWEGISLPTVFVSEKELKAEVVGNYFLTARKYNISVSNPPLGGGKSKELPFEVKPSYLVESVKVGDKFVLPETQNHLLHRICIYAFGENNALKQIKFDLSGTFKPQDLEKNAFTLWVSKDTLLDDKDVKLKDFPAASRLVFETTANTPLPIKVNEPFCLLLTANIAEKATAGHTIQVSPITEKDIQLSKEVALLSGAIPYKIGDVQTIQRIYLNNPTDSLSLVRWCRAMKGEEWERKWDFSQPVGKWHGIDLDQNGKVRGITLINNNLQGDLSDEIFTDEANAITSELSYLNLSGNKITGEVPQKIGKCKKMEYLDLSKNLMGGKINSALGELTNLLTLWFSYNRFEEIPESIGNCQKLRNLHCNNNKIKFLPESIGKLASLEVARFEGNELKKLPATFASLPNLKECYLQNNALHFEHLEPLAERPNKLKTFAYAPQAKIGEIKEIYAEEGKTFEIQIDTKGKSNQYTWHKDEKPYQTTQEPAYKDIVNYSKTGTYKLMVKNEKCKDLTLESYEYKVKMYCNNNLVQIKAIAENNDVFCADESVEAVLSAQLPTNVENKEKATFQWLKEGSIIHQADYQKFTAREVGNYAVRVSLPNGCTYLSENITISRAEKVAVRLQREGNLLMAVTKQDITNYEWFLNNRLLERNITSTINMVESGRYKARLTDKNGCQTTSAEENMNVTALEEIENLSIQLFPNPSANIFRVKLSKSILKSIWIFDAIGRDAHQESFVFPIKEYSFNLENKAVGIYWVRMQTTEGEAQIRIVKE